MTAEENLEKEIQEFVKKLLKKTVNKIEDNGVIGYTVAKIIEKVLNQKVLTYVSKEIVRISQNYVEKKLESSRSSQEIS